MTVDTQKTILRSLLDTANEQAIQTAVLRKALCLYQLALDAHEAGRRLAILAADDTIVHEVVGVEEPTRFEGEAT